MLNELVDILKNHALMKANAEGKTVPVPGMDKATARQSLPDEQTPTSHLLPSNMRWLGQSMLNPRPMTGKDISPQEHTALLQAYRSSGDRVDLMTKDRKDALTGIVNELKGYHPDKIVNYHGIDAPAREHLTNVSGQLSKTLQYTDYPKFRKEGKGIDTTPMLDNLTDPSYSMATTIGRADYVTEADGSVHVKDTYNFPGKDNTSLMEKFGKAWNNTHRQNLGMGLVEAVGAHFSKDMSVDIQLTPATRQTPGIQKAQARQGLPKPGYNIDENNQLDQLNELEK